MFGLRSKPAADKSPFGCKLCIPYRLRTLADSLGEDSLNVARCLGLQRESICWIEHVHEHDSDLREMSLQLLSTCAAQNESDFVERLAQALHEEQRQDLVEKMMRHECTCNLKEARRNATETKTGCCWVRSAGKCTIL